MYQAGENLGTAFGELYNYGKTHLGKYGKGYQRYLEKYKPEQVIGANNQVTFRPPEPFEVWRRKEKGKERRQNLYNRIKIYSNF